MSANRFLRTTARCLSLLVLAGAVCPHVAWGADAPADAAAVKGGLVVLDATRERISVSAGERDGITKGTEFRVLREGAEVARAKVTEVSFATSRAKVISGLPSHQLRPNDRAEMVGTPPRARRGIKFPWAAVVGAGVLALVVLGSVRDKGEGAKAAAGGVADVNVN